MTSLESLESLTADELVARCQAQRERYQRGELSDERYCRALFDSALARQDAAAWEALCYVYRPQVAGWIRRYSPIPLGDDDMAAYANEAFARLWQYGSPLAAAGRFGGLGHYLEYLKTCVWSTLRSDQRRKRKDALRAAVSLEEYDRPTPAPDAEVEAGLRAREIVRVLWERLEGERERLVAEESWIYDLPPRTIQERYPELFASALEVSQIKRNIRERLQRDPRLRQWTGAAS